MDSLSVIKDYLTGKGANENLAYQLLPVIRLSKILGNCPLSYDTYISRHERKAVNYSFHWKSVGMLITIIVGIPSLFLWLLVLLTQGLSIGLTWPIKFSSHIISLKDPTASKIAHMAAQVLNIMIPLSPISDMITMWLSSTSLSHILNNWNVIEDEMISTFSKFRIFPSKKHRLLSEDDYTSNINIIGSRNFTFIFFVAIPGCILVSLIIDKPAFLISGLNEHIATIIHIYMTLTSNLFPLFYDEQNLLMYKCLAAAFKKINSEIQYKFNEYSGSKGNREIEREEILQWGKIILRIRKQTELTGLHQALNQILSLLLQLTALISTTFLLVNFLAGKLKASLFLAVAFGFSVTTLARLVRQINAAVKITDEEKALAETILNIDEEITDISTRMEAKLICDLLRMQPSEISFLGYITLNRAFLLRFCSHITTYFIVLTQFDSGS